VPKISGEKLINIRNVAYWAAPSILGSAVIYTLYTQYMDDGKDFTKHLIEDVNWVVNRIPNLRENLILAAPMGVFNFLFESYVDVLYQRNPVSKTVIRNALGIATTSLNWKLDVEISSTGVKYDVGHVAGNVGALLCKSAIIRASYSGNNEPGALESASLLSNLVCEPVVRTQNLISQHRQEQNLTLSFQSLKSCTSEIIDYVEFSKQHIIENPKVLMQGIGEGVFKAAVSTFIGGILFGTLGISKIMRDAYVGIENGFLGYIGAAGGASFAQRCASVGPLPYNPVQKMLIYSSLSAMDLFFKVSVEVITGFLIVPGIRSAQDFIGIKINELNKYFYHEEVVGFLDDNPVAFDLETCEELDAGHQQAADIAADIHDEL
jgi:hypothetical protein